MSIDGQVCRAITTLRMLERCYEFTAGKQKQAIEVYYTMLVELSGGQPTLSFVENKRKMRMVWSRMWFQVLGIPQSVGARGSLFSLTPN